MNVDEFKKALEYGGYIPIKKGREIYVEKVNKKNEYDTNDIIHAYRWYWDSLEKSANAERRRNLMGGKTKRYKQTDRMGSDRY